MQRLPGISLYPTFLRGEEWGDCMTGSRLADGVSLEFPYGEGPSDASYPTTRLNRRTHFGQLYSATPCPSMNELT